MMHKGNGFIIMYMCITLMKIITHTSDPQSKHFFQNIADGITMIMIWMYDTLLKMKSYGHCVFIGVMLIATTSLNDVLLKMKSNV